MDHLTKKQRSELMSKIRGKNTKPELAIRTLVWNAGFRYRLHRKDLPGTPDLVFPAKRKVIFVNGCFWHGHVCRADRPPKSRVEFWSKKISRNKARDSLNLRKLRKLGWKCLTVWECDIRKPTTLTKVIRFLTE